MSRRSAILLTILAAAVITAALVVGGAIVLHGGRAPQVHLIPEGFSGWAAAAYGVADAPPLPVENGHQVFRYDDRGRLETSSPYDERWSVWVVERYYYVSGETRRPLRQTLPGLGGEIWGAYTASRIITRVEGRKMREGARTGFFVGTEEQYQAAPFPADIDLGIRLRHE